MNLWLNLFKNRIGVAMRMRLIKEHKLPLKDGNMKRNGKMRNIMAKENTLSLMEENTKGNERMGNIIVKGL